MTQNRTILDKGTRKRVHASIASSTVAFALHQGLALDVISEATGVSGHELVDPNQRLPETVLPTIWNLLSDRVPSEEPLTMRMAEATPLSFFADLAHGAKFTSTIREAVELMISYRRIMSDQVEVELALGATEATLVVAHPFDTMDSGRSSEVGIAVAWRLLAHLAASPISPKRVEFAHAPKGVLRGYQRVFGTVPVFGADRTALVFEPDVINSPVRGGNSELLGYVHNHLSKTLESLENTEISDPLSRLKVAVIQCSEIREFGPRAVSESIGLSYRRAQRLVAQQGTTMRALIDENRMAIAADFLKEGSRTVDEIAATLGYADDRAFRRAFKRHFLVSPSAFRRGKMAGKSKQLKG